MKRITGLKSVRVGKENKRQVKAGEKIPFVFTFTRPLEKNETVEVICQIDEKKFNLHQTYGTYTLLSALSDKQKNGWSILKEDRLCESAPIYLTFPEEMAGATLDITFSIKHNPFWEQKNPAELLYAGLPHLYQNVSVEVLSSETDIPKIVSVYWSNVKTAEYGKPSVARTDALNKNETVYLHIHTRGMYGKEVECKSSVDVGTLLFPSRVETIRNNVLSVPYTFHNDDVDEIKMTCLPLSFFSHTIEAVGKTITIPYIKDCEIVLSSYATQVYACPGSAKKAFYASDAECRVDFRPMTNYDGSFGFSWYRMGDMNTGTNYFEYNKNYVRTNQTFDTNHPCNDHPFSDRDSPGKGIMGKHYEMVGRRGRSVERVVGKGNKSGTGTGVRYYARAGGRDNFKADVIMADDHKKDYPKINLFGYSDSEPLMREYLVPVMTLSCNKSVELQLFLYVKRTPKEILFVFDNPCAEANGFLSVDVLSPIVSPAVTPKFPPNISHRIKITCHKPFDTELRLKAYAVSGNAKNGTVKKENGRLVLYPKQGCPLVLPELCGMLRILPNDDAHWHKIKVVFFSVKTNVNGRPEEGIKNTAAFSKKLGQLNKYLSQAYVKAKGIFEKIDLTLSGVDRKAYRNACFLRTSDNKYVLKELTDAMIKSLFVSKIPSKYDDSSGYIRIFFLPEECVEVNGFSVYNTNGQSQKLTFCFGGHEETTPVHELLHALGLPHTFNGISPNAKYTYEDGKTDNLMDYSHWVGIERKSLFEWQWETINQKINK